MQHRSSGFKPARATISDQICRCGYGRCLFCLPKAITAYRSKQQALYTARFVCEDCTGDTLLVQAGGLPLLRNHDMFMKHWRRECLKTFVSAGVSTSGNRQADLLTSGQRSFRLTASTSDGNVQPAAHPRAAAEVDRTRPLPEKEPGPVSNEPTVSAKPVRATAPSAEAGHRQHGALSTVGDFKNIGAGMCMLLLIAGTLKYLDMICLSSGIWLRCRPWCLPHCDFGCGTHNKPCAKVRTIF